MEIKRIGVDEAGIVTDLFDRYRQFYEQPADRELAGRYISQRLANNESVIFVAIADGTPAGFTQLYPTYSSVRACKNWILNDLYVDENHRKKGIGEALIRTAIAFAKAAGAADLQLETATDNHTAQRLYEAIGFEKQEQGTGFFLYKISV
ncbi:GNAT family N-acetyltransferase [Mucilaginibacter ginsenosidivorans]|uniref:GNAT family N-acetyltransferase n=1 Tax=Mucilaginibacter ginsenosidivorans TaxID=398053 RepID=A0A5B8UWE3_9SPHI|nr:GNAT family N-acetyltransferase [Mucilaginibacter ginsenosidivorans]QEC63450.1 GNAT family N-acetyltransferase [Mucilaginibacter ginsenosidivorans]